MTFCGRRTLPCLFGTDKHPSSIIIVLVERFVMIGLIIVNGEIDNTVVNMLSNLHCSFFSIHGLTSITHICIDLFI